jgi:hypothetical protein
LIRDAAGSGGNARPEFLWSLASLGPPADME